MSAERFRRFATRSSRSCPRQNQVISYGVPAFRVKGMTVAGFAVIPGPPRVICRTAARSCRSSPTELEGCTRRGAPCTARSTSRFPETLVRKLIARRLAESRPRSRGELRPAQMASFGGTGSAFGNVPRWLWPRYLEYDGSMTRNASVAPASGSRPGQCVQSSWPSEAPPRKRRQRFGHANSSPVRRSCAVTQSSSSASTRPCCGASGVRAPALTMTHGLCSHSHNGMPSAGGQCRKSHARSCRSSSSTSIRHSPARTRKSSWFDSA